MREEIEKLAKNIVSDVEKLETTKSEQARD